MRIIVFYYSAHSYHEALRLQFCCRRFFLFFVYTFLWKPGMYLHDCALAPLTSFVFQFRTRCSFNFYFIFIFFFMFNVSAIVVLVFFFLPHCRNFNRICHDISPTGFGTRIEFHTFSPQNKLSTWQWCSLFAVNEYK